MKLPQDAHENQFVIVPLRSSHFEEPDLRYSIVVQSKETVTLKQLPPAKQLVLKECFPEDLGAYGHKNSPKFKLIVRPSSGPATIVVLVDFEVSTPKNAIRIAVGTADCVAKFPKEGSTLLTQSKYVVSNSVSLVVPDCAVEEYVLWLTRKDAKQGDTYYLKVVASADCELVKL